MRHPTLLLPARRFRNAAARRLRYTAANADGEVRVSIHSVNDDLARLERDVQSLSRDASRLLDNVADESKTLREEAVAAEFIATEETMENVGSMLGALSDLHEIQRRQLRWLLDDSRASFSALTQARSPADLFRVGLDHWARRAGHIGEGVGQAVTVVANESRTLTNTLVEMWSPFVALLRRDWGR